MAPLCAYRTFDYRSLKLNDFRDFETKLPGIVRDASSGVEIHGLSWAIGPRNVFVVVRVRDQDDLATLVLNDWSIDQ